MILIKYCRLTNVLLITIIDENSTAPAFISVIDHHYTCLTKDYIKQDF